MRFLLLAVFLSSCASASPRPVPPDIRSHAVLVTDSLGVRMCSGVVIGPRTALTAAHCIERARSVEGLPIVAAAYPWPGRDIALVSVAVPFTAAMAMMRARRPERVRIAGWGCSRMQDLAVRVLRMDKVWGDQGYMDGRMCPGDSGAGVFDSAGWLVAIGTAYYAEPGSGPGAVVAWLD